MIIYGVLFAIIPIAIIAAIFVPAFNPNTQNFNSDIEDSQSPTWENILQTQRNIRWRVMQVYTFFVTKSHTFW